MRKALYALMIIALASCKKEDIIIKDNVPPPDHTIDSTVMDIYVNKAYVNLLGREPIGNEKSAGLAILKQNNFSVDNRKQFLETLFGDQAYNRNLYNVARVEYLANLDSLEIEYQIYLYGLLLTQPQYAPLYDLINYEIVRMNELKQVMNQMNAGTLDYRGMITRVANNYFYDQINMGTENFVVSTFQNFLFRYPTDAELENGKLMVDGSNTYLLLKPGRSKPDYINIFFSSDDFFEGQVRYMFIKYMFREPSSAEMTFYADMYKNSNNYKLLQKEFFALDEYAGIN